jgi:hypothetical protein
MNMLSRTIVIAAIAASIAMPALGAEPALQISYPTDAQMDCAAISAEVARMDALVAQTNQQVANADGSAKGVGLASAVAVEGLVRSGLLGRVPGAGMFANNAKNMANQRAEAVRANAAQTIQVAETRKAMLGGMFAGKACDAPATTAAPAATAASPGH